MKLNPASETVLKCAVAQCKPVLLLGSSPRTRLETVRRMQAMMPPLTESETGALREIRKAAGLSAAAGGKIERPLRTPHHSISAPGLCGDESRAMPGEAALAHTGLLFLDDLEEFRRAALTDLSHVLRTGISPVKATGHSTGLPAQCLLVAGSGLPVERIERDLGSAMDALQLTALLMPDYC